MDITAISNQMIVLFLLLLVGYAANKLGRMDAAFNKAFSGLIINVTTPALILHSVMEGEKVLGIWEILLLLAASLISYALVILLAMGIPKLMGMGRRDGDTFRLMIVFSNTAFMGFPVVAALMGTEALFYAAIFNMPFNFLLYTYGIHLLSGGSTKGFDRRTLLSPCVIAAALALVLYLSPVKVPSLIVTTLSYLAGITIPGAMLILGSTLALIPLRSVFLDWRIYALSLLKLVLIPILVWAIVRLIPIPEMIGKMTVVMWSLPVATNCTMLATQYGGDEALSSKGVLITTLLSVATVPILMRILY